MELRHLRSFLVLAEELHFARAGARLGIEQSPLSRQILDLEADLKVRLFARTRRSTTLTQAGEHFLAAAKRILADVDASIRDLRAFAAGGQPLRLGLAEGLAGAPFGRLLQHYREAQPAISIVLVERPMAELVNLASANGLDAILAPETASTSDLESVVAWTEPLHLILPATGEAERGSRTLASLPQHGVILQDAQAQPGCARQIAALLKSRGVAPRQDVAATPAALAGLVAAGAGVGLLPLSMLPRRDDVVVRPLRDEDAIITVWLTTRRGCALGQEIADAIAVVMKPSAGPGPEPAADQAV